MLLHIHSQSSSSHKEQTAKSHKVHTHSCMHAAAVENLEGVVQKIMCASVHHASVRDKMKAVEIITVSVFVSSFDGLFVIKHSIITS